MLRLCQLLCRRLQCDASLTALPAGVGRCEVYRHVVTLDEEELISEELGPCLDREGQVVLMEGSTPTNKIVRHTYLEMFGDEPFTEVRNMHKKEVRRLPGLPTSPTLMQVMRRIAVELLGAMPNTARVVEHQFPGYEMHVEHPTVGSSFLYLNLLSDTVLSFDDEATQRVGQVYLPSRSAMVVSGEARWGFRWGEHPSDEHLFTGAFTKRVQTDMRLGVQLWKLNDKLLDSRVLQERVEESVSLLKANNVSAEELQQKLRDRKVDEEEAKAAIEELMKDATTSGMGMQGRSPLAQPASSSSSFVADSAKESGGMGFLGGDLPEASTSSAAAAGKGPVSQEKGMHAMSQDYTRYKDQFANVHGILKEMKTMEKSGVPINDMWLQKKLRESSSSDPERDRIEGFDPSNVEGTWDNVDAKARFYKSKLRSMDYDGTANSNSTMPDVTSDAPLDMRATIRKIAPHVKDGEKMLSSLPGGDR